MVQMAKEKAMAYKMCTPFNDQVARDEFNADPEPTVRNSNLRSTKRKRFVIKDVNSDFCAKVASIY